MHTTSMNFAILSAARSVKSVDSVTPVTLHNLPKFVRSIIGYIISPRLQKLSFTLAEVCFRLRMMSQDVQRSDDTSLIDPELEQRESLDQLKQSILKQRGELERSYRELDPDGGAMPKLDKQIASLVQLMAEIYEVANELQWAIAEHDASYSERTKDFHASNQEELVAMLSRIAPAA